MISVQSFLNQTLVFRADFRIIGANVLQLKLVFIRLNMKSLIRSHISVVLIQIELYEDNFCSKNL
jgi:hypothetical protein